MKLLVVFLSVLVAFFGSAHAKTGEDFLKAMPAPVFKDGHTLLPLTRWAWPLSYELNIELAQRWGYALDIYPGREGEALDSGASVASRLVAFNKANGNRYPVSVNTRRVMHEKDFLAKSVSPQAWTRNRDGSPVLADGKTPVMKPYLGDADIALMANAEVARLKRLRDLGVKVALVLNGAEYAPGVPGHMWRYWKLDPEVSAWMTALESKTAMEKVDAYASNKAKQEGAIRDAVLNVMPEAEVVYYTTGDVRRGRVNELQHLAWAYPYRHMIKGGTIPSWEYYYGYFGAWIPAKPTTDYLLPHATNGAAQAIEARKPRSYNWVSAGWSLKSPSLVASDPSYLGFLKWLYTLGSVGNVAGYFSYPEGGFNGELGSAPPDWLRQIVLLSHVHATFTHLEGFLRNGDLMPGDGEHVYSKDLYGRVGWSHPSYEFANLENDPNVRVSVRKMRARDEWLIAAWAAAGPDRDVTVTIPTLGAVTLSARAQGTLYRALPGPKLTLLDPDGMDPSRSVAQLLAAKAIPEARRRKPSR